MEAAQEIEMDLLVSFKSGKTLTITGIQNQILAYNQPINLLASSNRYGYIFYATESNGVMVIPSTYIDQESRYLTKTSEDDDEPTNDTNEQTSIIHRWYIPGQSTNRNSPIIPMWIALNADESILAFVLQQIDTQSYLILLYDVVQFIRMPDSTPLCPPIRLSSDAIGNAIQSFAWNPAIPTKFIYLDGLGAVSSHEVDLQAKQIKMLGKSQPNDDNSSICWSPQGKQLVIVKYDGALELYEPTMTLKKNYPSAINDPSFPPCVNVLWISTRQFLLGFSENNPNEDAFFQVLITFEKDQPPRTQIYPDLFFDALDVSPDINSQYFYVRLNESKILFTGLSKSSKINVLGPNELQQDSLDIWTFDDQYRAIVKGVKNVNDKQPILTGMAVGLNSTLSITQRNEKLPPCPMLLLSNTDGVLQVYYYIHKTIPSSCRKPDDIKITQGLSSVKPVLDPLPVSQAPSSNNTLESLLQSALPQSNGFSLQNIGATSTSTPHAFNLTSISKSVVFDSPKTITAPASSVPAFAQQTPPKVVAPSQGSSTALNQKIAQMVGEFQSKLESIKKPISRPEEPSVNLDQSIGDLLNTLQDMTTSIETSIKSVKHMTKEHIEYMTKIENARHQIRLCQTENLYHCLKDRELDPWTQARLDSIKSRYDRLKHNFNVLIQLTHATIHDKSLSTNDEDGENEDFLPDFDISLNTTETMKHRIQKRLLDLSQKVTTTEKEVENLCARFNSDLLSSSTFTKTTMSSSGSSSLPSLFHESDAQILSHLQTIHPKVVQIQVPPAVTLNLSASNQQKKQSTIEMIKSNVPTIQQPLTPKSTVMSTPTTAESEGFKNMLRLVRTSIDLFSGATSPEQLQELANTVATSPLSSAPKSTMTPITKTPTMPKTANLPKTTTTTIMSSRPLQTTTNSTNILQTPAKSTNSPVPSISVTPATPSSQGTLSNTSLPFQSNRTALPTATDLTKNQNASSSDSAIRALLDNKVTAPTSTTSTIGQPPMNTGSTQMADKTPSFGNLSSTSTASSTSQLPMASSASQTSVAPTVSSTMAAASPAAPNLPSTQQFFSAPFSPASTVVTSVQSVSPTARPLASSGFGSKPVLGGNPLNFPSSNSPNIPFGGAAATANVGTSIFGNPITSTATPANALSSGFGVTNNTSSTTTTTTSVPSTTAAGISTTSIPSPFGSGFNTTPATTTSGPTTSIFGTPVTITTTSAPTTSIFGAPATSAPTTSIFGTTTTSAPTTSVFGAPTTPAPTTSIFGTATTSAPTVGIFGSSSTSSASPFGSGFGSGTTTTTSPFGSNFNTTTTATTTASASPFGNTFGAPPSLSSNSTFGNFGASPFGASSTSPSTSVASATGGSSIFGTGASTAPGGGTSVFGSNFSGFNTNSSSSGPSTGFSFGGFGGQRSDTNAAPSSFGSFGSPSTAAQPSSPFGSAPFGNVSPQSIGFGAPTSSFGASSTQSTTSPSFTAYRK